MQPLSGTSLTLTSDWLPWPRGSAGLASMLAMLPLTVWMHSWICRDRQLNLCTNHPVMTGIISPSIYFSTWAFSIVWLIEPQTSSYTYTLCLQSVSQLGKTLHSLNLITSAIISLCCSYNRKQDLHYDDSVLWFINQYFQLSGVVSVAVSLQWHR